jgi:hypothetical protein
MDFSCCSQDLLSQWVLVFCAPVGAVLLLGGARAAGAALVGSAVLSVVALLLKGLYGGGHLETLVHGAVILGSVGLVGFGLAGLALGADSPLGRYPAAPPCTPESCFRGFEDPWIQVLLAFNVAFLALLFLVAAWRESRSSRKH